MNFFPFLCLIVLAHWQGTFSLPPHPHPTEALPSPMLHILPPVPHPTLQGNQEPFVGSGAVICLQYSGLIGHVPVGGTVLGPLRRLGQLPLLPPATHCQATHPEIRVQGASAVLTPVLPFTFPTSCPLWLSLPSVGLSPLSCSPFLPSQGPFLHPRGKPHTQASYWLVSREPLLPM